MMVDNILSRHQLRRTVGRADVLGVFLNYNHALGHKDVEDALTDQHDRVTLYRILGQFEESGIIHKVLDNSGVAKYALCNDDCDTGHHEDEHVHFECDKCEKTYCLDGIDIPQPVLPENFVARDMYVLLKGKCKNCR